LIKVSPGFSTGNPVCEHTYEKDVIEIYQILEKTNHYKKNLFAQGLIFN